MRFASSTGMHAPDASAGRVAWRRKPKRDDIRTPQQLIEQYLLERELAARLRNAPRDERAHLYAWAYEELFGRIPHHPQLRNKDSPEVTARRVAQQLRFLRRWLTPDTVFVEIGAGDCALSFAAASLVKHVYAIDVSDTITSRQSRPQNFTLALSDGTSICVPSGEATLAYSNQLMEHLHPDDALTQLANIYDALAPGGAYVCVTPNRLNGPCDISRYFDNVATGFHLKEYTATELIAMFRKVGFRVVRHWLRTLRGYAPAPDALCRSVDDLLEHLKPDVRRRLLNMPPLSAWRQVRIVAVK